jgi:hypothetical protein
MQGFSWPGADFRLWIRLPNRFSVSSWTFFVCLRLRRLNRVSVCCLKWVVGFRERDLSPRWKCVEGLQEQEIKFDLRYS